MIEPFFDSNTLLYLVSDDARKSLRIETLLRSRGVVSVQVLNEFSSVARRKLRLGLGELETALAPIRVTCRVEPLTLATHDYALGLAQRYRYSIYDSLILAAALIAGCQTLYSEDMQHGQTVEGSLTILDPFR